MGVLKKANLSSSSLLFTCCSSGGWIIAMELYPGFALYRGLYEFAQYSFNGDQLGADGMRWGDLNDSTNGMREVLIIMLVEWFVVFFVAYYVDLVLSSGSGKSPLFLLKRFQKKPKSSFRRPSIERQDSKVFVQMEKPDVSQEVNCASFKYMYYLDSEFALWVSKLMLCL